jgi:hypothetical protein
VSLLVPKELLLKCEPDVASGGVTGHHGLCQVGGDGVGDLRLDDTIHAVPVWQVGCRVVLEDVVLRGVLVNNEEKLIAPTFVVIVGEFEDDVHHVADVLDTGGMIVHVDDGSGLMCSMAWWKSDVGATTLETWD